MDIKKHSSFENSQSELLKHGGNISEEAKRLSIDEEKILDASASIMPFKYSKEIQHCLKKTLEGIELRTYPDRTHSQLRDSISQWHAINPSMVLPGNGAAELITWAARDASHHGFSSLPSPGFSDYKRALNCWGSTYKELPLHLSWSCRFPQPFPFQAKANVIWITNPHNPTGQLWSRKSLEALLQNHKLVICDEAFLPLVPNGEIQSLIPLVSDHENLIIIRSLTKLFAIAGLRLGYAISNPKRLTQWKSLRDPWPLNGIAISLGSMLMSNQTLLTKHINKIKGWVITEGQWLHSNLCKLPGIIAHPSSTNFQLIQSDQSLVSLREAMAQQGILLRGCQSFKGLGENWLRISLQTRSNNQRIIEEMQKILN